MQRVELVIGLPGSQNLVLPPRSVLLTSLYSTGSKGKRLRRCQATDAESIQSSIALLFSFPRLSALPSFLPATRMASFSLEHNPFDDEIDLSSAPSSPQGVKRTYYEVRNYVQMTYNITNYIDIANSPSFPSPCSGPTQFIQAMSTSITPLLRSPITVLSRLSSAILRSPSSPRPPPNLLDEAKPASKRR